jgi:hypothetical protein
MVAVTIAAGSPGPDLGGIDVKSRAGLLATLDLIDAHGWESLPGRRLLQYARRHVVRPAALSVGFGGPELAFAEATGWGVAWETLAGPAIRTAPSPWGVVWSAVRRALLGERLANLYATGSWSAWRIVRHREELSSPGRHDVHGWAGVVDPGALSAPVSLSLAIERGYEPAAPGPGEGSGLGERLELLVDLLERYGWPRGQAYVVIEHVAVSAVGNGTSSHKAPGSKRLAAALNLPQWQARRVTVLLLGEPGWPGLVERLFAEGPAVLDDPAVQSAVRATLDETMRPPARVARTVAARLSGTHRIAS